MKKPVRLLFATVVVSGAVSRPALAQSPQYIFANVTASGSSISEGCNHILQEIAGQDVRDSIVVFQAGASAAESAGRLTLRPYRLVKAVDSCSPRFFEAMVESRVVAADIKFFRLDSFEGGYEHFYTVKLQNARISSIASAVSAPLEPVAGHSTKEIVSLSFQSMTLIDEIRGNTVVVSGGGH